MNLTQLFQSITKKEWQLVIIVSIVLILLTGLPFVYAYFNAPQGHFYNGLNFYTTADIMVYFSYINQIKAGNWLIRDYFTSEAQPDGLLNIFWLGVGLLARLLNLSALFTFHLVRLLLIPLFMAVLYIFVSYFFQNKQKRKLALLFACFSSGIGVYFINYSHHFAAINNAILNAGPIDLWVDESNIFLSLYYNPHFTFSWALMLLFFLFSVLAWQNNNYRYSILAGLVGFLWFNFHPYYFPYVFSVLLIYGVILFFKNKKFFYCYHFLISLVFSLPFVLYHFYKIRTDLVIGIRASQNVTLTPSFAFVFIGFGFLFIFSIIGIWYLFKNREILKNEQYLFIFVWLVGGLILIYAPVSFQRRFLEGIQLPMVILSIIALFSLAGLIKNKLSRIYLFLDGNYYLLILLFIIFFGFSTIFNLVKDVYYFKNFPLIYYLPDEYRTAANWIENNNPDNKVILSQSFDSWIIPGLVNQRIFLGHMHETIFSDIKKRKVDDFFANNYSEQEAWKFLMDNNIGFLFFSDMERKFYPYTPAEKKYFKKAWQEGAVEIWQFVDENS